MSLAVAEAGAQRRERGAAPGRRRAAIPLLAVLAALLLLFGGAAAPAHAHAELTGTTPEDGAVLDAPPPSVELRFTEGAHLIDGAIRLFAGDGAELRTLEASVSDGVVTVDLPADLGEGAYAIAYRVVSVDTHPVGGVLHFQIGAGEFPQPTVTTGVSDAVVTDTVVEVLLMLQYLGLLLFAGLLFFDRVVLRAEGPVDVRTRRLLRTAFWVAVSASTVLVLASGVRVTGRELVGTLPNGDLSILAPETWVPGLTWQTIAGAGAVIVAGAVALAVGTRARGTAGRVLALASAGVALATPMLVGHTQSVQPGWAMIAADLGHLAAGAFWLGGTTGLLMHLMRVRPGARNGDPRPSPLQSAALVARFSRFAVYAVVLLALSGTVMAVLILGSWGDLLGTEYGRTLLLKLGIVVAVLALAAWNRVKLVPQVAARPNRAEQWASLRRVLGYEVTLLVAVVAVTGVLTNTSPSQGAGIEPDPASSAQQTLEPIESQDLRVEGTVDSARADAVRLTLRLEYRGDALTVPEGEVEVSARLPEQQLGPIAAEVRAGSAPGEYVATISLPAAGEWQLQVSARVDAFTQPIAIVPVTVTR